MIAATGKAKKVKMRKSEYGGIMAEDGKKFEDRKRSCKVGRGDRENGWKPAASAPSRPTFKVSACGNMSLIGSKCS